MRHAILSGDEDRSPILGERLVLREQEHLLGEALSDQQAVERISMVLRELGNARGVTARHRKFLEAALAQRGDELVRVNVDLAEGRFDRDLPYACRARINLVAGVADKLGRARRKILVGKPPDQQVRVEQ